MNMFEFAVRNKMRFPFKGMISVEDLWDLNVNDLDVVFKTLNNELTRTHEASLLGGSDDTDIYLTTQIDIVRYIFDSKISEADEARKVEERNKKKQKLMELIVAKQDAELSNKSIDELKGMLEELYGGC